jgi:hypothetical protein
MDDGPRVCSGDSAEQVLQEVTVALSQHSTWWWCQAKLHAGPARPETRIYRALPTTRLLVTGKDPLAAALNQLMEAGTAGAWSPLPLPPIRTPLDDLVTLFKKTSGSVRYVNLLRRLGFSCAEELAALPDACLRDLPHGTERLVTAVHAVLDELAIPRAFATGPDEEALLMPQRVRVLEQKVCSLEDELRRLTTQMAAITTQLEKPAPAGRHAGNADTAQHAWAIPLC